ncbi:C40 family peptidase [Orrella dioscoreae]|uniref:C40 family peptidase n=1 Tax=Orrella dioscoreae TaxID=1851544 RepID=UPI0009F23A05
MTPPQRHHAPASVFSAVPRPRALLALLLLAAAPLAAQATPQDPTPIRIELKPQSVATESALKRPSAKPVRLETWMRRHARQTVGERVVTASLAEIGTPYSWGGDNPEDGFDCSGLVRFVFAKIADIDMPHRARQQRTLGKPVKTAQLQPGDLVFFNTMRHPASHVGIYIGEGKFVHAPSRGAKVRVDKLSNSYWAKRYTGGRRYLEQETLASAS